MRRVAIGGLAILLFILVFGGVYFAAQNRSNSTAQKSDLGSVSVGNITVSGAYAGATAPGNATEAVVDPNVSSAAYFTIQNDGDTPDKLIRVTCDVADAGLHRTLIQNNIAQMVDVAQIDLPPHSTVTFKPDDYHIMLTDLSRDLVAGETITFNLVLESGITLKVAVLVR